MENLSFYEDVKRMFLKECQVLIPPCVVNGDSLDNWTLTRLSQYAIILSELRELDVEYETLKKY